MSGAGSTLARSVYVTGLSLWAPGYRDLDAFLRGARDESVVDCGSPWVPARLLRGASRLTRMLGEVAAGACAAGGADPKTVATIYTSSYGEIETMVILLDAIFAGDGQLSPMRFKNSVHNAASGLGSIGTGNMGFSTALAAGDRSFEAGMLEAIVLLGERGGDAIVAVADDRLPEPLAGQARREALAVGVCLRSEWADGALAELRLVSAEESVGEGASLPPASSGSREEEHATNPAAAALPLLRAITEGRTATVPLAPTSDDPRPAFAVSVRPAVRI